MKYCSRCAELGKQLAEATDKLRKWGYAEDANRQLQIAREKLAENERISELHRQREMECIAKWQAENKSPHLQPDYGRLLDWLHEQLLEKDAQLEKANAELQRIRVGMGDDYGDDPVAVMQALKAQLEKAREIIWNMERCPPLGVFWLKHLDELKAALAPEPAAETKPQMMVCKGHGPECLRHHGGPHPPNRGCASHGCVPVNKEGE